MRTALFLMLAATALGGAGCIVHERGIPADMASLNKTQPATTEQSLQAEVRFDIGTVEVGAEKGTGVYSLELDYDRSSYEPEVDYQAGNQGRLVFRLSSNQKVGLRTDAHRNRARLNLSNALPLNLKVTSGVGETRLALSGLRVESLNLDAGVGDARISMYEQNPVVCRSIRIRNGVGGMNAVGLGNLNFDDLEFEGGVGGATLDFSGAWKKDANVRIQVGVGGVRVQVPRDIGVRVDAEKNFLSGIHLEDFTKRDGAHYSGNYEKARVRVNFRVVTGIGGFRVSWL